MTKRCLDSRLKELEKQSGMIEEGALICPVEGDPDRYTWAGHEGTYTLAEIEKRIDPGAVILAWDMTGENGGIAT